MVAFFSIKVIRRMIFLKTFNNSAALVQDDQGQEQVVLGKGIGFGLKKGDKIDESKIERRFIANFHQDEVNQVKEINASTIDLTNKMIQMGEPQSHAQWQLLV